MREAIRALFAWREARGFADSPWFFPSFQLKDREIRPNAVQRALRRASKRLGRKVTSHGARAYFVTVRRSQGASDAQIAAEIGHTSGGKELAHDYGGVPETWRSGNAPQMSWLPKSGSPAWAVLNLSEGAKIISLPKVG